MYSQKKILTSDLKLAVFFLFFSCFSIFPVGIIFGLMICKLSLTPPVVNFSKGRDFSFKLVLSVSSVC